MGWESRSLGTLLAALARNKMLWLMIGGAAGTCARYGLNLWIHSYPWARGFPYGTLIINVSGSFLLGVVAMVILERMPAHYIHWYLLLGTGFCGGYTTFSTFEWETLLLVRNGNWCLALVNVVASVVAGFVGVVLAISLVRWLLDPPAP